MEDSNKGVDKLVTLKEDIEKVLAGQKTAVRRNGKYAEVGDTFILQGQKYKIDRVYQQTLGEITEKDAQNEGYTSVEKYKQSILSIHPGMPWLPQMSVWVHEFHPVQD